jgi:DNA-damage-inducible protein J
LLDKDRSTLKKVQIQGVFTPIWLPLPTAQVPSTPITALLPRTKELFRFSPLKNKLILRMDVYTLCAQLYFEEVMAKETTINIRVDAKTKKKAEKIFARCGYTTSSAIRLFLLRTIKENDWPFDIHIPNAETLAALDEDPEYSKTYSSFAELAAEIHAEIEAEDKAAAELKAKRKSKKNAKS